MDDIKVIQKQMTDEGLELINKIILYINNNNERISKFEQSQVLSKQMKSPSVDELKLSLESFKKYDTIEKKKDSKSILTPSHESFMIREMMSKEKDSGKPLYKFKAQTSTNCNK